MRGSLCGYVVSAGSREPVAGAPVLGSGPGSLPPLDDAWSTGSRSRPQIAGRTDSAGRFAFDELREGEWIFWTLGSGGEKLGQITVHVFENARSEVTIKVAGSPGVSQQGTPMRPPNNTERDMPGSVRGRVVRADNGKPIRDATITVVRGAGPAPDIAPLTDRGGWFALDGLPAGDWVLRALSPGGETGEVTVRVSPDSVAETIINVGTGTSR